jgi:hypothetical protein
MLIYCFKVALFYNKRTYRNIEILESQSLHDLHESIFNAFDRYDEHLYSFYITRKAIRNPRNIINFPEYTDPINLEDNSIYGSFFEDDKKYNAHEMKIGDLNINAKDKIYYLFDFGDMWWHELTLSKIGDADISKIYPNIIKKVGESPDQYFLEDEDDLV